MCLLRTNNKAVVKRTCVQILVLFVHLLVYICPSENDEIKLTKSQLKLQHPLLIIIENIIQIDLEIQSQ